MIIMIKKLFFLKLYFFTGLQIIYPQTPIKIIPTIDFSKSYPQKEVLLQDIAEIKYIQLETNNNCLLSDRDVLSYVSDRYILIHSILRGDIYVFNNNGEIYSYFNHKGGSSKEYAFISNAGTILDEKNEEIFVCSQSIQVYSLKGEYKRTLPKNTTLSYQSKVFNFDDELLLVYEGINEDFRIKSKYYATPYYFINKKDGSFMFVLDINLPIRYSTSSMGGSIFFRSNTYYGQDIVIADISSDTLFLLTQNRKLTPLLLRKPSVHTSEPRIIWASFLVNDRFIQIGKIILDFNSKGGRIQILTYEFENKEIFEMSIIDSEFNIKRWNSGSFPAIAKNMTAELIWPHTIKTAYKNNLLKGDVEKLALKLKDDDNPVLRIVKFK